MNSIVNNIRKILLNRNTVTILAVMAGVIVLWFFYNRTVSNAVNPQRVPVATRDITATEEITSEDFEYVEVNNDFLKNVNVITSSSQLVGRYVKNETSIKEGAMFYTSQVVDREDLKEREQEDIPKDYTLYWLKVDNTSTYANSIYPGDKIDLWLRASINGQIIYDEFITSIDVVSVKDSNGQNVFDGNDIRTPAWLSFAVPTEMFEYLNWIEFLNWDLYPVPRNKLYTIEGATTEYSNLSLKSLIDGMVLDLSND